MIGLHRQGLVRAAIEVSKLLLAATLPRDPLHVLVHFDALCLQAKEYELLQNVALYVVEEFDSSSEGWISRLDFSLPNFAYSVALSGYLALGSKASLATLKHVSVADVLPSNNAHLVADPADGEDMVGIRPHAALMRAMLLFPQVLQPMLEALSVKVGSRAPSGSTSQD